MFQDEFVVTKRAFYERWGYQYNLKIVGVPLISERESARDTAELCVKLFTGLGVDISLSEIDIAHRVPQRDTSTGNGN